MRRGLLLLLLWASPALAHLPTSTPSSTYTRTQTPTATVTRTSSATPTRTATPTVTQTGTVTATATQTGTVTATPTAYVIYNRDGRAPAVPVPLPTGWCVKVLNGNEVGISPDCPTPGGGGGGGNLESSGATFDPAVCLDATVTTISGQSKINTSATLTAGVILNSCVSRINAAVTGGVKIGLAGAPDLFGTSGGSVGNTNRLDATMPNAGGRIISTQAVVVSANHTSGTFQESTGEVRVVCFCNTVGAPTE